jgi:hypothetical protein
MFSLGSYFLPGTALPILSLTFDAELAVGLIMRSRNEAGAALPGDLGAGVGVDRGFCGGFDGAARLEALLIVEARRLSVRFDGGESPCLADEDAVGATRWAGSFTGLVGDRGRGLMKPPVVIVPEAVLDFGCGGCGDGADGS